ncbi:LPXTG-motif cell wall anchor domain protein [uncultured Eubacteriales bacterium]|uniref:LPXTG-motif cell wall anchor domain protein n=1 Tax=uncultured Eubacteriales bacterium TaxID=172733 RepID=A0A212IXM5_9FIRM|nr:LPXTG-motif cell wall anchor domain protein [uncultured Eubacteriales bacterium]
MKIKSMTASFGKLRNARLELTPGLNLIQAPNEGGKSTWCAFIRAMLYGIPTRERDRQGYIAEKNRYQPWAGGPMEGEMDLTWNGRDITLRRGPKGSAPFAAFTAVYTGTEESVPGFTAENCGETLLGVSREVYERSAFVGQGGAAIGSDAELERRIAALVSSGEEDVSYSEVEGRLKEWQRRRKYNKSGIIPKLENERAVLDDTLARQSRARGQAEEAASEAERLTARKNTLSTALAVYKQAEDRDRHEKYQTAQAALSAAKADVEALQAAAARMPDGEDLRAAQGDLAYHKTLEANLRLAESQLPSAQAEAEALEQAAGEGIFAPMAPDEAWRQASQDRDRAAARAPRGTGLAAILVLLAAAAIAAVLFVTQGTGLSLWGVLGGGIALAAILAVAGTVRTRRWRADTQAVLNKYAVQYPDDILALANAYRERRVAAQEGARRLEAVRTAAADLRAQKAHLTQGLLDTVHAFEPHVTDLFGVSAALSRGLSIREKLTAAQVRLEGAAALAASLPRPEGLVGEAGTSSLPFPSEEFPPQQLAAQLAAVEGELARRRNDLALATGELNTLGDSALFEARREELEEELERRSEEHDALALALEALGAANATLQSRFSPALNAEAGEVLSALTGGKYTKVGLNRQFEASAQEADAALPRSTIALSQGTAEQVYLAVRLAVCALALPAEKSAPLILDDALDAFDDTRMALALDYLLTLAQERQILLFTCHTREGTYLGERKHL